jgi:hypothetical protein
VTDRDPSIDWVDTEEAMQRLVVREGRVHTFVMGGLALIGADWDVGDVFDLFEEKGAIEAGENMSAMKHTLGVNRGDEKNLRFVFFEADRYEEVKDA